MGRWGMRLFEADQDLDLAVDIDRALDNNDNSDNADLGLFKMINQTDMIVGQQMRGFYETDDYKKWLEGIVSDRRELLNSGIGDELFKVHRTKEHEPEGKYRVILVGALMMRAGATIKDDDFKHLREIVPDIPCRDGLHPFLQPSQGRISYRMLIGVDMDGCDKGFRHAGKVQFLAALDNYKPGVPRSFRVPSCYNCGKIAADAGETALSQCSKCKRAWYCNTACQRAHWRNHKPTCVPPEKDLPLNV